MRLAELIEELRPFKNVVVVGPQRSGTRIAARILAHELGAAYRDEAIFTADNWRRFLLVLGRDKKQVIQAPALTHKAVAIDEEGAAVVIVRRGIADILASQRKLKWRFEDIERDKLDASVDSHPIAQIKYQFWDTVKVRMHHAFELHYDDLARHPMFVPKQERVDFKWNQTARR